MPVSKKQSHARAKQLKDKITVIEQKLRMPVISQTEKSNLEYELARLKKNL